MVAERQVELAGAIDRLERTRAHIHRHRHCRRISFRVLVAGELEEAAAAAAAADAAAARGIAVHWADREGCLVSLVAGRAAVGLEVRILGEVCGPAASGAGGLARLDSWEYHVAGLDHSMGNSSALGRREGLGNERGKVAQMFRLR